MLYVIAGHGAGDPGAVANGFQEAERVRVLAARMGALGGSGVIICDMSRNWFKDGGISSASFGANAEILELHLDSHSDPSARGGSVRIKPGIGGADAYDNALANFIGTLFPNQLGGKRGVVEQSLGNADRAYLRGIPYRLLECCFISNTKDIAKFNADIDAVARGILAVFGVNAQAPAPDPAPSTGQMYRVRSSWDAGFDGQIGAFENLDNAKRLAESKAQLSFPYKVYDKDGKQVFP